MFEWHSLVHLSDEALRGCDLAAVNLACAAGLPGAEGLDVPSCLTTLDGWANQVRRETVRCAVQFTRDPADFENSWAYFRVLVLVTVLQEDFGLRYNRELCKREDFFGNAANLFVHGVAQRHVGTCSNLPPVYVAVGRRLGYPLRLSQTTDHLFARWDDPVSGERFNVECTSRGLVCHDDDYYLTWPHRTTVEDVQRYGLLASLTPREELAGFLISRGHCWLDNDRFRQATEAYAWACAVTARHRGYEACLALALARWRERLDGQRPPNFPQLICSGPRHRFPGLADSWEREITYLQVLEDLLNHPRLSQDWWQPLKRSPQRRPTHVPARIIVRDPTAIDEPGVLQTEY
jgi:hypothetical protein